MGAGDRGSGLEKLRKFELEGAIFKANKAL
jgi:hypothetical protein